MARIIIQVKECETAALCLAEMQAVRSGALTSEPVKPACHHASQPQGNGYDGSEKNMKIGTCVVSQRSYIRLDIADVPLNMLDGRFKLRHPRFHTIECAPSTGRLQGRPWRL